MTSFKNSQVVAIGRRATVNTQLGDDIRGKLDGTSPLVADRLRRCGEKISVMRRGFLRSHPTRGSVKFWKRNKDTIARHDYKKLASSLARENVNLGTPLPPRGTEYSYYEPYRSGATVRTVMTGSEAARQPSTCTLVARSTTKRNKKWKHSQNRHALHNKRLMSLIGPKSLALLAILNLSLFDGTGSSRAPSSLRGLKTEEQICAILPHCKVAYESANDTIEDSDELLGINELLESTIKGRRDLAYITEGAGYQFDAACSTWKYTTKFDRESEGRWQHIYLDLTPFEGGATTMNDISCYTGYPLLEGDAYMGARLLTKTRAIAKWFVSGATDDVDYMSIGCTGTVCFCYGVNLVNPTGFCGVFPGRI